MRVGPVFVGAALALSFALGGCTSREEEQTNVAQDLRTYVEAIQGWEPKEKLVLAALARVKRSHYADDDFVLKTLKDTLPQVRSHIEKVEKFEPQTMDVSELYDRYLQGWRDLEDAVQDVITTVERKDYLGLAKAKNRMETAQAHIFTSYALLDDMLELHDETLRTLRKS